MLLNWVNQGCLCSSSLTDRTWPAPLLSFLPSKSALIRTIKTVFGSSLLIYPPGFLFCPGLLNCFSKVVPRCVSR